jgi:hypothetical protein
MAARTPRVNPESTWELYSALAAAAQVDRPLMVKDPRVITGRLRTPVGERAVLVNTSPDQVEARLATAGSASYGRGRADMPDPVEAIVLTPFEVDVLSRLA